ncbi:MAG TPA: hypothetical protein VH640_14310 [Bryobacteraceae bacterium]
MSEELLAEPAFDGAEILELGVVLGQSHAFGLVAGRCSAAQAESIRRLREQKLFKRCCEKWEDFCPEYLKMSRAEADRIIRLLEEFGATYFELSQLTRVSAETYRAIAPAIENGVLHFNDEAIPLNAENSRKVAAAVAEMRSALTKKSPEEQSMVRQVNQLLEETSLDQRLFKLEKCALTVVKEFEKIASHESLGASILFLRNALSRLRGEMDRVALEIGVE